MSIARTVAAGVIGLGLGIALGMVLFGGGGVPTEPARGPDPVEPAPRAAPAPDDPAPRRETLRMRKPRERVGPSAEVSSLLERAAAGIAPPEIPEGDGRIEGTVKTRIGEAVAGVEVTVVVQAKPVSGARPWRERPIAERFEALVQGDRLREATTRTAVSGVDGRYVFERLPAAAHTVTGDADHYRISHSGQHRPGVTPDAVVDLVADPVVKVPLDVTLEDGTEPDQVMVSFTSGGAKMAMSWSPSNREMALNPGTYRVSAASGDNKELTADIASITLVHGEPVEPVVLVLASRPGIAGRLVLPEGSPFVWAAVSAELVGADTTPESVAAGQQKAQANQHEEYRFSITGLTPGRYLLVAWNMHQGGVLASREVTVGEEMAVVDLEVAEPAREDYLEIAASGPDGEQLSGFQVQLRFKSKRRNSTTGSNPVQRPDGVIWVKHMPASRTGGQSGTHYVVVTHPSYGTTEVEYRPGPTARADVVFQAPAFVDVTVVGAPADLLSAGLKVNGTDASNRSVMQGPGNTDAEGKARVGPLQPGVAKLSAMTHTNRRNIVLATHDVTVRSGDNEARLVLPSLHTLRVECADPTALVGQSVRLRKQDGDKRTRPTIYQNVPASGKLVFRFVPQGKYEIRMGREKRQITLPGNDLVRF